MSESRFRTWPLFSTQTAQVSRREGIDWTFHQANFLFLLILRVFYPQLNSGPLFSSVKPSYWKLHPADFHGYFPLWGWLWHKLTWWMFALVLQIVMGKMCDTKKSSDGTSVNLRPIRTNHELNANIRVWGRTKGCHMDLVQRRWWHRFCSLGGSRTSMSSTELQTRIWLTSLEAARSGAQERGILH